MLGGCVYRVSRKSTSSWGWIRTYKVTLSHSLFDRRSFSEWVSDQSAS